mmetsp:Transcript_7740/g.15132  ORF Transcript_7740/g.15132 Transcript_7740/m.15132 type:complete len:188 (-) Transcript_7740:120-683(-)
MIEAKNKFIGMFVSDNRTNSSSYKANAISSDDYFTQQEKGGKDDLDRYFGEEAKTKAASVSRSTKKKKKKKKKSDKSKKPEKQAFSLPSADSLLDSGDVPDFLATHQKEEKSIMVEKKIEADLERKKKIEAEIAMMEAARMREAEKEFEYDVADKEYKAQRARIKSLKPKVPKGPNIMNRMSIHRFH